MCRPPLKGIARAIVPGFSVSAITGRVEQNPMSEVEGGGETSSNLERDDTHRTYWNPEYNYQR
jgi:hypothetical protein